jgi:predicted RNA-binding Zn-ribbon protein involved in translation (DUF1610 family)
MTEKNPALSCPCCGGRSIYTPADRTVRQSDHVMCIDCGLEIMTDYVLGSALAIWNKTAPTRS